MTTPAVGIENLRNTCFFNAALQALLGVPSVFEAICRLGDEGQGEVVIIGDAWAHGVYEIADGMSKGQVDPKALHRALLGDWQANVGGQQQQQYFRGQQMDAAEFVTQLIERIAPLRTLMTFSMQDTPPPAPPTAGYCSLPVPPLAGVSLDALVHVEYNGRPDEAVGHRIELARPMPRVLHVELKRYSLNPLSQTVLKDESSVTVRDELLIYSAPDGQGICVTEARYICKGAVYHLGESPKQGHYVADSLRGANWMHFNDDAPVSVSQRNRGDAYLLVFERDNDYAEGVAMSQEVADEVSDAFQEFSWINHPQRAGACGRASQLRDTVMSALTAATEDQLKPLIVAQMQHYGYEEFVARRAVEEILSQTRPLMLMPLVERQATPFGAIDVDIDGLEMWNDRANWTSPAVDKYREITYRLIHRLILQHPIYSMLMKHKLNDTSRTIFVQRPEQSGKTNTCIMLAWLSNVCYGQAAYVILRSGTAAAEDYYKFEDPVNELNLRIWRHMVGFTCYTDASGKEIYERLDDDEFERRLFKNELLETDDSARKGFMQPFVMHSHHLHTGDKTMQQEASQEVLRNRYPLLYKRLMTPSNIRRACNIEIPTIVSHFGVDEYGFANMTLLIDEYQQATKEGTKVHEALHSSLEDWSHLKDALVDAIEIEDVDGRSEADKRRAQLAELDARFQLWEEHHGDAGGEREGRSHFSACIKGQVRISATTVSGQVTFEQYEMREAAMLALDVDPSYYGDAGSKNIVDGKAIKREWAGGSDLLFLEDGDYPDIHVPPRLQKFCLDEFRMELERDGFSHTLLQGISSGNNANLFEWAKFFVDYANSEMPERAVVAVTAYMYTTAGHLPGGPWLVFSDAALPLREHIAPLAAELFISVDKKNGVRAPGRRGRHIAMHKGAEIGPGILEIQQRHANHALLENCLQLPKNGQLYLPKLLLLVEKATVKAGVQPKDINLITIGNGMLKVGMTPKTDEHKMGVTLGLISATERQIKNQSGEDLSQGLAGRIAGPRTNDQYWEARGTDDPPRVVTSGTLKARIEGARAIQKGTVEAIEALESGQTIASAILQYDYRGLGGRTADDLAVQFHAVTPAARRARARADPDWVDPGQKVVNDAVLGSTAGDVGARPRGFRTAEEEQEYLQDLEEMYEEAREASVGTPAEGKLPRIGTTIWKAWVARREYPAYPAIVTDLQRNQNYGEFPVVYTLQYEVDENFNIIENEGNRDVQVGVELDLDMNEWEDVEPDSAAEAREAAEARQEAEASKRQRLN